MEVSLTEVLNSLQEYGCKTKQTALALCRDGKLPAVMKQGRWYMDSSYIVAAVTWRKRYISLEELEKESAEYTDLDTEEKKHCDRNIRRRLAAAGWAEEPGRNGLLFTGTLYPSDWESKIRGIIDDCVKELHMRTTLIPASVAAKNMGMSVYQLKQSVRSGTISGIRVDDDLYIDPEVIADYQEEKRGLIGVFDWLKDELPEMGIRTMFDLENRTDRAMLNNMLRQSAAGPLLVSWEQAGFRGDRCNSLYFPSAIQDQVREIITRYLKDFGRREELYTLRRQDPYWRDHQRTLQALDIFERTKTKEKMASLYEIFIEVRPPEIMDCTDADIERLVKYAAGRMALHQQYLSMFLGFVRKEYCCKFTKLVLIDYQKKGSTTVINTSPYSLEQYMLMAYMAFNDDYINEEGLIEKALEDPKSAYCWLYTTWHYVAAWRTSDIEKIPIVRLPWSREDIAEHVKIGDWHRYAEEASLLLEHAINSSKIRPSKTSKRDVDRYLSVVFAESLREIIGLAYLIVYVHSTGEQINAYKLNSYDFGYFFGDEYRVIIGNYVFGNRRANKSFLDHISEIVEKDDGKENRVMGYMVASYARAHSVREDGLAAVTAKYLGIKMDGMTKDQIIMSLFESGTCSFVPYMLLSVMSKDRKFECLRVEDQSRIIRESGVSAYHAEMISRALAKTYAESETAVKQVLSNYSEENKKVIAEKILKAIVSRHAVTPLVSTQCFLLAAGKSCPYGKCVFGCRYALYEHGSIIYAAVFIREKYDELAHAKTDGERRKFRRLIEDCYIPAVVMMLTLCHERLKIDISTYQEMFLTIMKEGEKSALHIEKS